MGRHEGDTAWSLDGPVSDFSDDVTSLIHCAWVVRPRSVESAQLNVTGSLRLLSKARKRGLRFIFISTMSASDSTASIYGGSKRAVEKQVLKYEHGIVVRPGTISDGAGDLGMLDDILRSIGGLPLVPRVTPEPYVPIVALDRVARIVAGLATSTPADARELDLIDEWVTLSDLVAHVADDGRRSRTAPVPQGLITGLSRLARRMPVPTARDMSDSWLGLIDASSRRPT